MKIRILSDLHLEFESYTPTEVECDLVVLAGDIDVKARGVTWASAHFKQPVLYVPGNHEYYGGSLGYSLGKLRVAASGTNVHVMNEDTFELDGVRFIGATMWTDYRITGNVPLAEFDAMTQLVDFRKIRNKSFSKLKPWHIREEHNSARKFLMEELDKPYPGKTVVISHHAPCALSIAERYKDKAGDHLSAAYASELSHLMDPVDLWVHGHTHDSFDYIVGTTRVLCNPRGYSPIELNPQFKETLVLEI